MKKDDPKKKKLPFYGRAHGGAARRRADRKAYRRGGSVKASTTEPISPNEPNAPASGKVLQQFKKGGVAKRAAGGATAKRLDTEDDSRPTPVGDVIGGAERFRPGPQAGVPTVQERFEGRGQNLPLIMPSPERRDKGAPLYQGYTPGPRGLRKGGGVKKRAAGGATSDDSPTGVPKSSSVADLSAAGLQPLLPALGDPGFPMGGDVATPPAAAAPAAPGPVMAMPPPPADTGGGVAGGGMRRGGVVQRKSGGALSAAQRQSLPKSDFALPGQGTGPKGAGSGSYPINDPKHARLALARSSGKPVAAQVRAKVKAKYPGIGD